MAYRPDPSVFERPCDRRVLFPFHLSSLVLLLAVSAQSFDVILDPAEVTKSLAEIERLSRLSRVGPDPKSQLDALYEMGERVLDLIDLMNKDKYSHGATDPSLAGLIERRLKQSGVVVSGDARGYHYDLAAFREYLRRAPQGERVADARYVLIGFDDPAESIPLLNKSITDKMLFIHDYPRYSKMPLVKFLLAQQHVQLGRAYAAQKKHVESERQNQIARNLYRQITKLYPKTPEAEAAADYLEQTGPRKE
jgi:hypothetical protein